MADEKLFLSPRMETYDYDLDVRQLTAGMAAIGLPVSTEETAIFNCAVSCSLYRNPDGTIRWLWPVGADQPDFLRFFRCISYKDYWFAWFVELLFQLKRGHWVAQGRLTLYTTTGGYQTFRRSQVNRWALSMGADRPDRKLVLWYNTRTQASYYMKIALTPYAVNTLRREALALRQLQRTPFLHIDTPHPKSYAKGVLIQTDIGLAHSQQSNSLTDLPNAALQELAGRNWYTQPLRHTRFWLEAHKTLTTLRSRQDTRIPCGLLDKVEQLMGGLNEEMPTALATAHGNFSAGNVMMRHGRLGVVDWSRYRRDLPGLYDLFHFLYNAAVSVNTGGFNSLRREIDARLCQPEWQLFCEKHHVDTDLAEMFYLIHTIPYQLLVYSNCQNDWYTQNNALLTAWSDALTYWLSQKKLATDRQLLLNDLGVWLHNKPYAALKYLPEQVDIAVDSSDVDLCMPQSVASQLVNYLREHPCTSQLIVERRSFMKQLTIRGFDKSSLHVDLIWSFKQKRLEFMVADEVWKKAIPTSVGLKVPSPEVFQSYRRLFYGLAKAAGPDRYKRLFEEPEGMQLPVGLANEIRMMPQNRGFPGFYNWVVYNWDAFRTGVFRLGLSEPLSVLTMRFIPISIRQKRTGTKWLRR